MRVLQGFIHNGYTIIVNHTASAGVYRDAFSIHRHKDGDASDWRVTAHQRSITQAKTFPTLDEAVESALTQAKGWIDAKNAANG